MTSLLNRFARPALVAILLAATASQPGYSAQAVQTAQSDARTNFDLMPMFRASVTGAYMAGQQALQDLRTDEAARYFYLAAQADWQNPVLVERAFIAFAADGQIGQAASTAKHLLELDPTNELAELVVATEALKERRYDAAERQLGAIGQDSFTGITASILRAWALVGGNRKSEADDMLDTLGESGLDDFLVFHRALMAEVAGETDLAIDLASQAFESEPYVARIVEVYSRMLANAGKLDEAKDVITEFQSQGLSHPVVTVVGEQIEAGQRPGIFAPNVQVGAAEMFHGIGVALSRDGSLDLSLVFLRMGLYLDPNADVISLALGELLDTAGQHDAANRIYDGVPVTSAMKPTAVVRIAQNLDALGDREEALRRLSNIVVTRPHDLDAVSVYGDMLRYDEQYAEAAAAYSHALEITGGDHPSDWRFYYVRGIAYERAKEWPKAEADFLKALELNPDQPAVLNYLGYSWIDQDMHLEEALGMIEKAVDAQPQDGYIVDSLGWAFYKLGRIEEAVRTLERAVLLRPNDPELNDHLGDAYWKVGRRLEARFQWNVAAAMDEVGNVKERVAEKLADGLTAENATQ
ncbi:tetratricopeptide repeat protein [Devosia sp. J2-20]|uniref:Tetratricopeptide repeat protein n=1 Tax=Devosia litorisediminis TaxID=2829817 RepID=A0A942I6U5_9HYPH|nr:MULTISPECIES: tetratricopeptide repeat protein [Devosia]MBS3849323.1 tetratricopeptide repeat protein [Devosia litorisediminis]MCZ4344676.1 tetratricopeptide repeat protein [Devosia neptuniae]WDQ97624.1 tetratricopeptide repeat protein [Devosia sp. J2-20]